MQIQKRFVDYNMRLLLDYLCLLQWFTEQAVVDPEGGSMGSDEPPFLTFWTFLSEYLVDLKSWSTLQDPRTCNLTRNERGQREKWAWFKIFACTSHAFY